MHVLIVYVSIVYVNLNVCTFIISIFIIGRKTRTHILVNILLDVRCIWICLSLKIQWWIMIDDDWWWLMMIDNDAYDEDCWLVLAWSSLKMFQNVRPSFPSDYKWSRWWMTMNEHKDCDDLVWHIDRCLNKYVQCDVL